ncbi:MAG: DMT family protein [Phycisphaerales bacterium]
MTRILATVGLLIASNIFMTAAWYGHLKWFPSTGKRALGALLVVVAFSWLLALPEYCLQVPANRLGHAGHGGPFSTPQLKVLQEAITLLVFAVFSIIVLGERFRWTDLVAFALIFAGVAVSMTGRDSSSNSNLPKEPPAPEARVLHSTA